MLKKGSRYGAVGIVVPCDTRGPRFESSNRQTFILNILCTVNYIEKTKEAGNGPLKLIWITQEFCNAKKVFVQSRPYLKVVHHNWLHEFEPKHVCAFRGQRTKQHGGTHKMRRRNLRFRQCEQIG